MTRVITIAGLVFLAAIGAWFLLIEQGAEVPAPTVAGAPEVAEEPGPEPEPDVAPLDTAPAVSSDQTADPGELSQPPQEQASRSALEPTASLRGVLTDETGAPVENARLSWTPVPPELADPATTPESLAEYVASHSLAAVSDASGRFSFDHEPEASDATGSVLWITHERFQPLCVQLDPPGGEARAALSCTLDPAERHVAIVRATTDERLSGAIVEQSALSGSPRVRGRTNSGSATAPRLAWLLRRSTMTGSEGLAPLQVLPGVQLVVARSQGLESTPWKGVVDETVSLRIGESITVQGELRKADHVHDEQEYVLSFEAVLGTRVEPLASLEVEPGGFGPIELPWLEADEYRAHLTGLNLLHKIQRFHPEPGEAVSLDFEAEYGYIQWFFASNEEDEPLPEAELTLRWRDDGGIVEHRQEARDDGYIATSGIPPGVIEGKLRCPGYVPLEINPFPVPESQDGSLVLVMKRSRSIRGTCAVEGEPVPDFEVHVWPTGVKDQAARYVFSTTDGAFEIEDAPLGDISLRASAPGIGASDTARIAVGADPEEEVVLELVTGIVARGVVLDDATGAPIPDARVQAQLATDSYAMAPLGAPVLTDRSGSFEISGLTRGEAMLQVDADGYSREALRFSTRISQELETGIIRLVPQNSLTVWVVSSTLAPSDVTLDVNGPDFREQRPLDSEKKVRFEKVDPGDYYCTAALPDGSFLERLTFAPPGKAWSDVIDLSGTGVVSAEVVAPEGTDPTDLAFFARTEDHGRINNHSMRFDASGRAVLQYQPSGQILLEVRRYLRFGLGALATRRIRLSPGEERSIRFVIGENDRAIRVVDANGDPIQDVSVAVNLPGGDQLWAYGLKTDASGVCVIPSMDRDEFYVHLRHPVHGLRVGIRIAEPASDEPVELVLDGHLSATFVVTSPGGPASGINVELSNPDRDYIVAGSNTDPEGRITWHNLTAGEYGIALNAYGFWPDLQLVTIGENQPPIAVHALRLCPLEIETVTDGLPRPNVQVALHWIEGDLDVHEMLKRPYVKSSSDDLRTSPDGTLHLEGIPEGQYRWTVRGGEMQATGLVDVRPNPERPLVLVVP